MLALTSLPKRYIEAHGRDRVAEIIGVKTGVVAMWIARDKFPLDAVEKLLAFDPTPLHEVKPLYTNPEPGNKLLILMPCNGSPERDTMRSIMRMYDPKDMDFETIAFNNLSVVRNQLAAIWLARGHEWAFWADADSVFPCGNAAWFKQVCDLPAMPDIFAGVHTIFRLLVHKKSFVSVSYVARRKGGVPQFSGGESQRVSLKRGPRDELLPVDWCGFGGVLMNIKVLKDIIATQGEEITVKSDFLRQRFGYNYHFFSPTNPETPGDDLPLCKRAIQAGHRPHVDLAIAAGHVGSKIFNYSDL